MLKSGMSMEQVLEHFQREAEKKELKNKLQALLDDQNASTDEIFNALRSSLSDADNAKIDEMLKRGMTMEEISNTSWAVVWKGNYQQQTRSRRRGATT